MKKNLKNKIVLIVAVLLVFVYGIFGLPSSFSGKALAGFADQAHSPWSGSSRRRSPDFAGGGVRGGQCRDRQHGGPDPAGSEDGEADLFAGVQAGSGTGRTRFEVEGTDPTQASAVRSTLDAKYSNEYDVSGGSDNSLHRDDEAEHREGAERQDRPASRSRPSATAWTRWA